MTEIINATGAYPPLQPPAVGAPIDKIAAALAKAQSCLSNPERNREVTVISKKNPGVRYTFKYATLDRIIDHVRKPLTDNGLWFTQTLETADGGKYKLVTTLLHESGQFIRSETPLLVEESSNQAFGSALTYMRRYALTAMLGIAADEDDDTNRADGNTIKGAKNVEGKTTKPDLSDVRGDGHQSPSSAATPNAPASDIQNAIGPFIIYDLQGEATMECADVRGFLTELGAKVKENALLWGTNHHTVEWMEKEYPNQKVPGGKDDIEKWTRKLRLLAKAGQRDTPTEAV